MILDFRVFGVFGVVFGVGAFRMVVGELGGSVASL
jgi:hypothetical protein